MIPDHAPFAPAQRQAVLSLLQALTPAQRFWLAGFLSASPDGAAPPAAAAPAAGPVKLTILYGSESGNAERLADASAKEAKKRGFQAVVKNMADLQPAALASIENLLVIISTWGEGDPPETAVPFYKAFMSGALDLKKTRFSVCGLGDTAYEKFCQMGKDFDARLEHYGAHRLAPRVDCDVDYEEPHRQWLAAALDALGSHAAPATVQASPTATGLAATVAVEYGKKNPFPAPLQDKVLLNDERSAKETWHYEFSLAGSGYAYEPGDALAVIPVNAPDVVDRLLAAAKRTGDESIVTKASPEGVSLREALRTECEITTLSRNVLTKLAAAAPSDKLAALLGDDKKEELKNYLWGRWGEDALRDFAPDGLSAGQLLSLFRKLPLRLYSIASSLAAHPDEVHLTVASVRYRSQGLERKGVASTYLADLVNTGDTVPVFIQQNKNFRLPASGDTPIIMVGPGTGVAPFRAFAEHRAATGAAGKSWLFFGDQHYLHDFLYQTEWQEHLANGTLSRLDVAFSRDQPEKIYVQHKMRERGAELYAWLKDGAHFYVCGDASRMAHDVHEELISIFQTHGGLARDAAEAEVEALKKDKRYQRDVY